LYELNSSNYPIGALTLEASTPYTVSGSAISGSTVVVAKGVAVSGSVPYYGIKGTGAKTLTITDPAPRVIPHIGDDGIFNLQVLPPLEAITGELVTDKTNDILDKIAGSTKSYAVGEMNMFGMGTNMRGFEGTLAGLAYAAAQDADPDSANFGQTLWDFRVFPKANVFARDTGYRAEDNERMYTFTPMYTTAYPWGVQYTLATEGFVRAQMIRGVAQYKPTMVSYLGDGSTVAFPFDSAQPAQASTKIVVWKNGVIVSAGVTKSVSGLVFSVAPSLNDVIVALYETP
jgi:hypothetical protein